MLIVARISKDQWLTEARDTSRRPVLEFANQYEARQVLPPIVPLMILHPSSIRQPLYLPNLLPTQLLVSM